MKRIGPVLLCAGFLISTHFPAVAETIRPEKKRLPKIGLVLSGGGARGITHVGVLKVLEELRIPISFVAGTSMGAAVGGLYAAGIPADELEKIFRAFDMTASFSDAPSRRDLSFRRKEDDRTFTVKARIGVGKEGVKLPRGFVEGQTFVTELRKLSQVTEAVDRFDHLPIPFRALATDLGTGQTVVLDHGDLVKAIRASIAISPLFTPIEIDGRLLADGGYLRNIPVETVQKMGADRLIVVNIGTPLTKQEDINSVISVTGQVARLGGSQQDNLQLSKMAREDILIQPDLGDLSFTDFEKIPEFIRLGEQAARALSAPLAPYSLSEEDYAHWRASLPQRPTLPRVDVIKINNGTRFADRTILPFIRQPMGETLDPVMLQKDLAVLNGLGYFDYVDYHVEPQGQKNVLVIDAPRKSWGPNFLRLGFKTSEDFNGQSQYGILASFQMTELNSMGGEFRLDGDIGTNSGVRGEFYQPVGKVPTWMSFGSAPYFTYANAFFKKEHDPVLIGGESEFPFERILRGAGVGAGRNFKNWGRFKLGLNGRYETWQSPALPVLRAERFQGELMAELMADTMDRPSFPRHGVLGYVRYRNASKSLGSDASASALEMDLGAARSWGKHTARVRVDRATNLDLETPEPYLYRLGGLLNLSGFGTNNLVGTERALGQVQYLYQLKKVIGLPWYAGTAVEWGGAWNERSLISAKSGFWAGSLFTAVDTGIGPVYLAFSKSEMGVQSFYLCIGMSL
ncbi:MAG: patatin-like phospholipase family protein [Elusimicrobia bacterium]|nr:patatin-like phospholipase family protein [Elusimicrobiota bacterium]